MTAFAADFYDRLGDREFARASLLNVVSEVLHRAALTVARGRALDIGAGVGRFSVVLARQCSSLVIVDVSDRQLQRNRTLLRERSLLDKVERFVQADVRDLGEFPDASFDAVVCFRGPLNYCVSSYEGALAELFRVLRPGGILLLSVRSVQSGIRPLVRCGLDVRDPKCLAEAAGMLDSPVLENPASPPMRLFSAAEMLSLVAEQGGVVERMSGDGVLAPWLDRSVPLESWTKLVRIERRLASDPYGIAGANHLIFSVRKPKGEPAGT